MQPLLVPKSDFLSPHVTSVFEVHTQAIVQNYKTLQSALPHATCGAVVKADAYGFGVATIAPLLENQGCQHFFVAHLEEGLFLRSVLKDPSIYVFSGLLPHTADLFIEHDLIPILNDFGMVQEWATEARKKGKKLPCGLHFDTGMRRNGFDSHDLAKLFENREILNAFELKLMMSHLVSSQASENPINEQQKHLFDDLRTRLPKTQYSLADTGGIYLGAPYHYDLVRSGKGLFGLYTPPSGTPPLLPCVKVLGRILQIRHAHKGESVGYSATHTLTRASKLAVLGIGFADGYDRRLSNNAHVMIQGFPCPVVGRISMDYTVVDMTDVPEGLCHVGGWAELVNETLTLDTLAHRIGTISRELSTGLGQKLCRVYG